MGMNPRSRWKTLLGLGSLLLLPGCDSSPLLFPEAVGVELLGSVGLPSSPLDGLVDAVVSPGPSLVVVDARGNPVPGARVRVFPAPSSGGGGATLDTRDYVSDRQGRVVVEGWRLGEVAGPYELRGQLMTGDEGVAPPSVGADDLVIRALARPGAPAFLRWIPAQSETPIALVNQLLPEIPTVRATDRFGNPIPQLPVEFRALVGGGSPGVSQVFTDAQGEARPLTWRMGAEVGPQALEARLAEGPALADTLRADAVLFQVEYVHVNQGNQTLDGTIPVVADRPGLLRVFLRGGVETEAGTPIHLRLRRGGEVVLDETFFRGDGGGIPTAVVQPDLLDRSWNLSLPPEVLRPGTELQLRIEVEGAGGSGASGEIPWPADGGWHPLDVVTLPPFRALFLPIYSSWYDLTGRITPQNGPDFWTETLDSFPIAEYDFQVRSTPFVYDGSFADANAGWVGVLQQVRDLRITEGATDRYYHGILQRPAGAGIAGIAYVATQPQGIQNLAAISFDAPDLAGQVIAHEFGHNFGRSHSPCGNVAGVDPAFPHAGGRLGGPGWGAYSQVLRATSGFRDIMSYCFPLWSSDYTFASILAMRLARPVGDLPPILAALLQGGETGPFDPDVNPKGGGGAGLDALPAPSQPLGPPREGLLVGGGWSDSEGVFVRPAVAVTAPLTPESPGGDARIELLDAQGRVLSTHRFAGARLDHAEDPSLRHVGAVIPAPQNPDAVPAAIRLTTPLGVRVLEATRADVRARAQEGALVLPEGAVVTFDGAGDPGAPVRATRVHGPLPQEGAWDGAGGGAAGPPTGWDRVRVIWDPAEWPVLLLRDEEGRIQGFLHSGDALVPVQPGTSTLDLTISDGVRSRAVPTPVR